MLFYEPRALLITAGSYGVKVNGPLRKGVFRGGGSVAPLQGLPRGQPRNTGSSSVKVKRNGPFRMEAWEVRGRSPVLRDAPGGRYQSHVGTGDQERDFQRRVPGPGPGPGACLDCGRPVVPMARLPGGLFRRRCVWVSKRLLVPRHGAMVTVYVPALL